jgi:hypothetical protein
MYILNFTGLILFQYLSGKLPFSTTYSLTPSPPSLDEYQTAVKTSTGRLVDKIKQGEFDQKLPDGISKNTVDLVYSLLAPVFYF